MGRSSPPKLGSLLNLRSVPVPLRGQVPPTALRRDGFEQLLGDVEVRVDVVDVVELLELVYQPQRLSRRRQPLEQRQQVATLVLVAGAEQDRERQPARVDG